MSKIKQLKSINIEDAVMGKIKSGKTHMRPRFYYIVLAALSALSVIFLSITTVYFISVTSLWLRISAAQGPAYGVKQNLSNLITTLPWWALAFGLLSMIIIIYLVKKVGFLYKIRLIYMIPVIVSLFLLIGFIFSYSALPNTFETRTNNNLHQSGKTYQYGREVK